MKALAARLPPDGRPTPPSRAIAAATSVGFGLVGLAINAFPIELLSGVHVTFGGLGILIAAMLTGPWGGLVAGAIAGSITFATWGHPWAWVLLAYLGAGTGLLIRRLRPLEASALLWLAAGPVFLLALTLLRPHYPLGTSIAVTVTNSTAWLVAALLVQVTLIAPFFRRRLNGWLPKPIRDIRTGPALLSVLALGAVLPLVVLASLGARLLYHAEVGRLDTLLVAEARTLGAGVSGTLAGLLANTAAAADGIDRGEAVKARVEQLNDANDGLSFVVAQDARGRRIAAAGPAPPRVTAVPPGRFREPRLVYVGASAEQAGRLYAVAPIDDGGQILAEIDSDRLLDAAERFVPAPLRIWVMDVDGRVLADSAPGLPARSSHAQRAAAVRGAVPGGVTTYLTSSEAVRTLQPQATARLAVAPIPPLQWRAVVEAPQALLQPQIERGAAALLAAMLIALVVTVIAAFGLSRMLVRPVRAVSSTASRLAAGERGARASASVQSAPLEVRQLGERFDEMADALAVQLEATERASRVKDEFLTIASHELKTPITTLKAQLQLMRRWLPQTEQARVGILLRQVDRLTRLVDQLLDASRLAAGHIALDPRAVDLSTLLSRLVEETAYTAPLHDFHLDLEPVLGHWDESRLEQVFQNLLANAVKYSPQGGVVEVRLRQLPGGGAHVEVADRGIGVGGEEARSLFDIFARGEAGRREGIAGLGVGLFVSAEIVHRHGGAIDLAPRAGGGTLATVDLPQAPLS